MPELKTEKEKGKKFREILSDNVGKFDLVLPSHINSQRFVNIALTAMNKMPKLLDCTPGSVMIALMECGALGLEPFVQGQCYLLPYEDRRSNKTVCQVIIGYRGYVHLGRKSGLVDQWICQTIKTGDYYEHTDFPPMLKHKREPDESKRGDVVAAYSAVKLISGDWQPHVMYWDQIEKRMKNSASYSSAHSPWKLWHEEMCMKTPVRSQAKMMPIAIENPRFGRALEIDDAADVGHRLAETSDFAEFQELDEKIDAEPEPAAKKK